MLWALLLYLAIPTVDQANRDAALLVGRAGPECDRALWRQPHDCSARIRAALRHVADRESVGNFADHMLWQGRHARDGWADARVHRKAQRRPTLAVASWCPWVDEVEGSSTVGNHGLMSDYNRHFLDIPGNCIPWWVFAAPRVSSIAAARKYVRQCGRDGEAYSPDLAGGWCPALLPQMRARRRRVSLGYAPDA